MRRAGAGGVESTLPGLAESPENANHKTMAKISRPAAHAPPAAQSRRRRSASDIRRLPARSFRDEPFFGGAVLSCSLLRSLVSAARFSQGMLSSSIWGVGAGLGEKTKSPPSAEGAVSTGAR